MFGIARGIVENAAAWFVYVPCHSGPSLIIQMISTLLLTPVLVHVALASDLGETVSQYIKCHDNVAYPGAVLQTVIVRSAVHCAAVCSRNALCQAINVCSQDDSLRQNVCILLRNISVQSTNLRENISCFQMVKVQLEVTSQDTGTPPTGIVKPLECENNGSLVNGRCECPMQYGGTRCQRLIRDCTEAYDNGHTLPFPGRPLLIQPVPASAPFPIICIVDWGTGVGYPLLRTSSTSLNVNWTTARTWVGDDLRVASNYNSIAYFIGLENLHDLLSQAAYQANLNVYGLYNNGTSYVGWMYYSNFSVGPENSSYVLSYGSAWTSKQPALDDGFASSHPLIFSTNDRDSNHCSKGHPGWFGSDCTGYSLFADSVQWPADGMITTLHSLNIGLVRTSSLAVD